MTHTTFNLRADLSEDLTRELIWSLQAFADEVRFVVPPKLVHAFSRSALHLIDSLAPDLLGTAQVREWPGNLMLGPGVMDLYRYRAVPEVFDRLLAAGPKIFDWVSPALPGDLHMVNADGGPVLGSIAQEKDAWVTLKKNEAAAWNSSISTDLRSSFAGQGAGE